MRELPEVEEIHSVAGDTCMLVKARTSGTRALESVLARIYPIPGVKSTPRYIALNTYPECCVQAAARMPDEPMA
jgi:Lrp/AsnC family leucine-responsive transcriptional regulator